jgi:hypothetical protein
MSKEMTFLYASCAKMTGAYSSAGSRISAEGPYFLLEEYIFLMLHPCCRSNWSRSACVTRTAYATPLVSGRSNAVLSAYLANVACK